MKIKQQAVAISAGRFVFFILLSVLSLSAQSADSSCTESAQPFWTAFGNAVLGKDLPAIANLSRFPLVVRGSLDDSAATMIVRDEFNNIFPSLLDADPGMSPASTTMESLLNNVSCLSPSFFSPSGGQFRVGTWVFELTSEGWRFVQAFTDE